MPSTSPEKTYTKQCLFKAAQLRIGSSLRLVHCVHTVCCLIQIPSWVVLIEKFHFTTSLPLQLGNQVSPGSWSGQVLKMQKSLTLPQLLREATLNSRTVTKGDYHGDSLLLIGAIGVLLKLSVFKAPHWYLLQFKICKKIVFLLSQRGDKLQVP